jgi:hypothetical protein
MVRGDVASRALATAAEYNARAAIATGLMSGFRYPSPPAAAPQANYLVTSDQGTFIAKSFGWGAEGLFAVWDDDTRVPHKQISYVEPLPKQD